jgi:hypothetical protein
MKKKKRVEKLHNKDLPKVEKILDKMSKRWGDRNSCNSGTI